MDAAGMDVEKKPPHMAQCRHTKERRSPAAQSNRWDDVRCEGIASAKQQIEGRDERDHPCHAIEDKKKYNVRRYMIEKHRFKIDISHFYGAKVNIISDTLRETKLFVVLLQSKKISKRNATEEKTPLALLVRSGADGDG